MNKRLLEGYSPVLGQRALAKLNRDLGHGIAGRKMKFDAPGNYTPGQSDDMVNGFYPGSVLINEEKDIFMCVDGSESKAIWMKLPGKVTAESYDGSGFEKEPEPAPQTETETKDDTEEPEVIEDKGDLSEEEFNQLKEHEGKPDPTATASTEDPGKEQAEEEKPRKTFAMGAASPPGKSETAIPEEMPWHKYIKKGGLQFIEEVAEAIEKGTLTDVAYMNEGRVADVKKWLESEE